RRVERNAIFGEARRDMGVMVLRLDEGQRLGLRPFARELGRQIFGMAVGDESARRVMKEVGVQPESLAVVVESLDILQIALMLREDSLAVLDETERSLKLPAHRHKLRRRLEPRRKRDRRRRKS